MLLNQFAWPVSMEKIVWHTYIIFTIWCGIQSIVIYFFIPETKNRTVSIPKSVHLESELTPTPLVGGTRRDIQLEKPCPHLDRQEEVGVRRIRRSRQHPGYRLLGPVHPVSVFILHKGSSFVVRLSYPT